MWSKDLHTPVAIIIFNRSDTTERVLAEIAKAKPQKLFVIADGPRDGNPEDAERCAAARAVIDRVDWQCEVIKNYSDVNLGCGNRPASGISWVFEHVEEAIILEDDCVPNQSFFRFCEELLERYRDDERIMHIAGNNFQFDHQRGPHSYFFSFHNISWGWATWRRAWSYFDLKVKQWQALKDTLWLLGILKDDRAVKHYREIFDIAYEGNVDFWDYQWSFACWAQHGLSVLPNTTLVTNIGCQEDATHTKSANYAIANLPKSAMVFPLQHPPYMVRDSKADQFWIEKLIVKPQPTLYSKLRRKLSKVIPGSMRKSMSNFRSKLFDS